MEKINGRNVLILLLILLLTACQSYKKVPYLQDAEVVLYSTQNEQLYDATDHAQRLVDYCSVVYQS